MNVQDLMDALKKFPPDSKLTVMAEETCAEYDGDGNDIETIELVSICDDEIVLLADDIEVARLEQV